MEEKVISLYDSTKHQFINLLFVVVFLTHNILFFFQGSSVDWHAESWIKYLKYFILVLFILYNTRGFTVSRLFIYIFVTLFFLAQQFLMSFVSKIPIDYPVFYNFYAALTLILISPRVFKKKFLLSGILIVACFSIFFTFFEYFFLQSVITKNLMNHLGFYRCGSCFLNSNAAGACFAFFSILFIHKITQQKRPFLFFFLLISVGIAIVLTKSRSSLILFVLCYCYSLCRMKNKRLRTLNFTGCFFFILYLLFSDTDFLQIFDRADGADSVDFRVQQIQTALSSFICDPFFPINRYPSRLDCGIFQFIFDFGLFGFIFYFSIFLKAWFKSLKNIDIEFTFFSIFFLFFFVTLHNIFPFSYFIVFLVSSILEKPFSAQNELYHKEF